MMNALKKRRCFLWILAAVVTILMGMPDLSDARSSGGGRSFGGSGGGFGRSTSRSFGGPSIPPPPPSSGRYFNSSPGNSGGSSFWRGVGGGLVGGLVGNMLFGRSGYSSGHGNYGGGGGGFGLFDLLILGGLGYFLYKRFIKPNMGSKNVSSPFNPFSTGDAQSSGFPGPPPVPPQAVNTSGDEFYFLRQSEPDFDPEKFKEIAQDVFFKIQAAWMRRDTASVQGLIGQQLKSEYDAKFAELKQKGLINRLENIAVRHIEIADAGQEGQEVYIKVLFTANLLDYVVEETSGNVVKGDPSQPVKFEEYWTFAHPVASTLWKLEGIQEK